MSNPAVVVVGGGLAGTVLGRTLQNRGWDLELFHHPQPGAATPVAAGLWNPINFFRLIPGWRVEESLASMLEFFEAEEQAFGQTFLHPMPYGQPLFNADHLFQWEGAVQRFPRWLDLQRDSLPGLENLERLWGGIKAWGLVREAGWLDVAAYIHACHRLWESQGRLNPTLWKPNSTDHGIPWVDARGVFARSEHDVLARLKPTQGELVEFTLSNGPASIMIKRDLFLQPLGQDRYRAGATFEWQNCSPLPTREGQAQLRAGLVQLLGQDLSGACDFEYKAGIRPSSHDRRPYVGRHHYEDKRWVFNGFGAKGVLLAPLMAKELASTMEGQDQVHAEAKVGRLKPIP